MRWIILVVLVMVSYGLDAQKSKKEKSPFQDTQTATEKAYNKRIKKDKLDGVYIPKDLTDAFKELNKKISATAKTRFKALPEAKAIQNLKLKQWMMLNWSFYDGSRLSAYMTKMGVSYPMDMSELIILAYHRYLNKTPLALKAEVNKYRTKRKQQLR